MGIAYFDGRWVAEEHACVPVTDLGFQYGLGAFTTLRVHEGNPEHLGLHLQRLVKDSQVLRLKSPSISFSDVIELIDRNSAKEGIYRLKIYVTPSHCIMTIKSYTSPTKPYRLCLFPEPVLRPTAHIKSLSYLDRHWIKNYAVERGCDEAVVVDGNGIVLEAAFANLYWQMDNCIFYPDPMLPLLHGIALQVVLEQAKKDGRATYPVRMTLEQIPPEAKIFCCNSMIGSWPVSEINHS